jgi:predicted DNA-binding protein (MmcQ/YjbR family)
MKPARAQARAGPPWTAAMTTAILAAVTQRLREFCLRLPEAGEAEAWVDATFWVRGKIFAMTKFGDGRISVWCKAPPGSPRVLVGAEPETFFVPPYVGSKGWVGMRLDDEPDWNDVSALVGRSYRLIAPKRLAARATGTGREAE